MRTVNFQLNGVRRDVTVPDKEAMESVAQIVMADPKDKGQVSSSIPGAVSKFEVKAGDKVEENQVLAIVEAMKMETSIVARMAGVIGKVLASPGQSVKAGELLMTIEIEE